MGSFSNDSLTTLCVKDENNIFTLPTAPHPNRYPWIIIMHLDYSIHTKYQGLNGLESGMQREGREFVSSGVCVCVCVCVQGIGV